MAQRFGKSLALDYLRIEDPVLAIAVDDALHQRLVAFENERATGRKSEALPPDQRYATDLDYDDSDFVPPPPPAWMTDG